MLILDLWGISFHAVVVFGLGKNLLFKSVLGHCEGVGGQKKPNIVNVVCERPLMQELLEYFSSPWIMVKYMKNYNFQKKGLVSF